MEIITGQGTIDGGNCDGYGKLKLNSAQRWLTN